VKAWPAGARVLGALALTACAATGWPDEPGVPVPMSYAANVRAADAFLDALTAARAGTTLPTPTVTPSLQQKVRLIAEFMQRGELSAAGAQREALRWGQSAYHRNVEAWVLDCGAGAQMRLPRALSSPPVIAIAYAASHFQPRSRPSVECALVVISAGGSEQVGRFEPSTTSR
jgi:hypothetical protein